MTITPLPDVHRDTNTGTICHTASNAHRTWRAMPVKSTPPPQDMRRTNPVSPRSSYRPMTVGDEVNFAWALSAAADGVFSRRERAWMCVTLGAGDSTRAVIEHLLASIATHDVVLQDDLVDSAFDWLVGYTGTEDETRLRALVETACPGARR